MEIKLKLEEVLKLNDALKAIIDDNNTKINVLLKFRLLGIMKALETYVLNFEIIRNEKIVEYGKKNEDGSSSIDKNDKVSLEKFKKDLEQILVSEVTINIEMLSVNEVFDSGVRSDYLMGLFPIIKKD